MAVDISRQLKAIAESANGEEVLSNIYSALLTMKKRLFPGSNIGPELDTIDTGVFGADIREAIVSALYKLSIQDGSGSGAIFTVDPTTFNLKTNMVSAIIPEACTSIGSYAFSGMQAVETIVTPTHLESIGDGAFRGCLSLQEIEIPNEVIEFGEYVFENCETLQTIVMPDEIDITPFPQGSQAYAQSHLTGLFKGCTSLVNVTLPENLWFISESMFEDTGITSLSDIVTTRIYGIEDRAFAGSKVTTFTIPEAPSGGHTIENLGIHTFEGCTHLRSADLTHYHESNSGYVSPAQTLYDYLFAGCTALETVQMPDLTGYGKVGTHMFDGCTNLRTVTLTEDVTYVYEYGFADCTSLASLGLDNIVVPSSSSFSGCTALTEIKMTVPTNAKTIAASAFENCSSLVTFVVTGSEDDGEPGGYTKYYTSVGISAFQGCSSLETISLSYAVTAFNNFAFKDCTNLETITWDIPESQTIKLTTIGTYVFDGCTNLTAFSMPTTITALNEGAFQGCSSLTSMSLPRNITTIAKNLFNGCSNLATVTVNADPSSVAERHQTIGEAAFKDCSSLTSVELQSTIKTVGKQSFSGCASLTSFTVPTNVTAINERAFENCTSLATFTANSKAFTLGVAVFYGCTSLTSVSLPLSSSIGSNAFENCTSLVSANFGASGLTTLPNYTFKGCTSFTTVYAPYATTIGLGCFTGCTGIVNFVLPPKVATINANAFEGCSNMATFGYTEGTNPVLKTINAQAFLNCTSLTSITFPSTITTIKSDAFAGCTNLTHIKIEKARNSVSGAPWGAPNMTANDVEWNT